MGNRSKAIGFGVASIVNVLDPEVVVLGGGAVAARKIRLAAVHRAIRHFAVSRETGRTPVVFGKLGDAAQAIGAALLSRKGETK